jgi:uncharacterized DUF497 family protein
MIQENEVETIDNVYTNRVYYIPMTIKWDEKKNQWLILHRHVSFEEITGLLLKNDYIAIIENPTRKNQQYFIMHIKNYTWVVPFNIDEEDNILLRTAFPSRKFHRRYGGRK